MVREDHWEPLGLGPGRTTRVADGSFACEGVEAGRYSVRAGVRARSSTSSSARTGSAAASCWASSPRGMLRGRVLDPAGAPRSGASIYVGDSDGRWLAHWGNTITLLETGSFEVHDLPPGEYTLLACWAELAGAQKRCGCRGRDLRR